MKKIPTKADIRTELQQMIDRYAQQGGQIQQIPTGISGRENPLQGIKTPLFTNTKTSRTPVPEVIAALDARRQQKTTKKSANNSNKVEKIIYDDFGEPLRRVWKDQ